MFHPKNFTQLYFAPITEGEGRICDETSHCQMCATSRGLNLEETALWIEMTDVSRDEKSWELLPWVETMQKRINDIYFLFCVHVISGSLFDPHKLKSADKLEVVALFKNHVLKIKFSKRERDILT